MPNYPLDESRGVTTTPDGIVVDKSTGVELNEEQMYLRECSNICHECQKALAEHVRYTMRKCALSWGNDDGECRVDICGNCHIQDTPDCASCRKLADIE